jgi:magnesium transporter
MSAHVGLPPGSLPPTGPVSVRTVAIRYGEDSFESFEAPDLSRLADALTPEQVTWIDVQGIPDAETMKRFEELFGFHPLALEDVAHAVQRAKVDRYPNELFIVCRMPTGAHDGTTEQLGIFLRQGLVVTFQDRIEGDCLGPVRARVEQRAGRIRSAGADFLAYSILDAVVDSYFPLLDAATDELDVLEESVLSSTHDTGFSAMFAFKRRAVELRRAVWPLRDVVTELSRGGESLIQPETQVFLRDCSDHTYQIIDLIESHRERASVLVELQLSMVSNRMNEVMKLLTIISTIFIPMSFLASLYGMNFNTALPGNMPELGKPYGYVAVVLVMAASVVVQLIYYYSKGWIGGRIRGWIRHRKSP